MDILNKDKEQDSRVNHASPNSDYEIVSDGLTVWVNSNTGMCIGRFNKRGMDVHHDFEGQMQGKHCLGCSQITGSLNESWQQFARLMKMHYGVLVGDMGHYLR